jgi:hypothetical protein
MKRRIIAISTIARIIKVLTDSRSEPNTIGMGPMSRIPAPLVWPPAPLPLIARSITATKANTNPMVTSASPMLERLKSSKLSPFSLNRKSREL